MFPRLTQTPPLKPFKINPNKPISPRAFRAEGPMVYPPPETLFDYKPPSLLRRHGPLALVFFLAAVGVVVFLWKALHAPAPARSPADPVYVEPLAPAAH